MADTQTTQNNTLTKEEVQKEVQEEVKSVIVESMQVVKKYVDDNSIKNEVERAKLKTEIENAIAQKYDFEAEKEKLDRASEVAETLLGLFDENKDNNLDPKEFLDKLNSIYAQLETTNKLSDEVKNLVAKIGDIKSYIDTKFGEVKGKVDTITDDISKAKETIKTINAELTTKYFTKDEVMEAMKINKDEIVKEVTNIFYPATDDNSNNGDGATL